MTSNGSLLNEIFPHYDVSAQYSIRVNASATRVFKVLQQGLPSGAITKILMALRGLPRIFQKQQECAEEHDAFYRLKELENREIVIGIVGQFWKPVSNPLPIHSLQEFLDFKQDNYCKAALNLQIHEKSPRQCLITTETRVLSFGAAKSRFRDYWRVIGPFSGLIRREILRKIKKRAEAHGG